MALERMRRSLGFLVFVFFFPRRVACVRWRVVGVKSMMTWTFHYCHHHNICGIFFPWSVRLSIATQRYVLRSTRTTLPAAKYGGALGKKSVKGEGSTIFLSFLSRPRPTFQKSTPFKEGRKEGGRQRRRRRP